MDDGEAFIHPKNIEAFVVIADIIFTPIYNYLVLIGIGYHIYLCVMKVFAVLYTMCV